MAGMWIAHVTVDDPETYGLYAAEAGGVLESHGGKLIARGARYQQMEGPEHARNVVAVFPTFEDAVTCYNSEAYQRIKDIAVTAADRVLVIVETDDL